MLRDTVVERKMPGVAVDFDAAWRLGNNNGAARQQSGRGQFMHELGVRLQLLADPLDDHGDRATAGHRGGQGDQSLPSVRSYRRAAKVLQPGDRVAVWAAQWLVEQRENAPFDLFAHDMFPAARLDVQVLPVQSDDVREESLGEPMLSHDSDGFASAAI